MHSCKKKKEKATKQDLGWWNKNILGSIQLKLKELTKSIKEPYTGENISLTRVKEWEIQRRQQFRIKWLPTIDLNYNSKKEEEQNRIFEKKKDENYISPREEIEGCFVNYFENLFKTSIL